MAEECKDQLECLEGQSEGQSECPLTQIKVHWLSIEKQENGKTITYKLSFIDCVRFMASSVSNLTDNLAEGLHKGKYKDYKSSTDYMTAKDDLLTFKCVEKTFHEDLSMISKKHVSDLL